jgi:hypothetical protein
MLYVYQPFVKEVIRVLSRMIYGGAHSSPDKINSSPKT